MQFLADILPAQVERPASLETTRGVRLCRRARPWALPRAASDDGTLVGRRRFTAAMPDAERESAMPDGAGRSPAFCGGNAMTPPVTCYAAARWGVAKSATRSLPAPGLRDQRIVSSGRRARGVLVRPAEAEWVLRSRVRRGLRFADEERRHARPRRLGPHRRAPPPPGRLDRLNIRQCACVFHELGASTFTEAGHGIRLGLPKLGSAP